MYNFQYFKDLTDFEEVRLISFSNTTEIQFFTQEDEIALEYEDRVLLIFTPYISNLESVVEGYGEYIRDTATINIIDDDRKLFDITYVLCSTC